MKKITKFCVVLVAMALAIASPQVEAQPNVPPFYSRLGQGPGGAANLGDVNDDGVTDYAVGWRYYDATTDSGRVTVLDGATGLELFDVTGVYCGGAPYPGWTDFGRLVVDVGDANKDGITDFAVSVGDYWRVTSGYQNYRWLGKVYIYSGDPADTTDEGKGGLIWEVSSDQIPGGYYADFGRTIANAGDVNGDDTTDFVVGTGLTITPNGTYPPGQVFVFDGTKLWDGYQAGDTLYHWSGGWRYGSAVDGGGDVNGDGHDDIVISQYGDNYWGQEGKVWVRSGATGDILYNITENPGWGLGSDVAMLENWNGDEYADFAFNSIDEDRVYIFYGNNPGAYFADDYAGRGVMIQGPIGCPGGNEFSCQIAALGDVDVDGYSDLAIATESCDSSFVIVRGGEENGEQVHAMISAGATEYLTGIGDVSGDGYPDVTSCNDGGSGADMHVHECSPDTDGDGYMDVHDYCPGLYDPTNADSDGDHVGDLCDNCPGDYNPDQEDWNFDGVGDSCDPGPIGVMAWGVPHFILGGALLDASDLGGTGLVVSNIGSTGDDGVGLEYMVADFGAVGIGPVDPSVIPLGAYIRVAAVDNVGTTIGSLTLAGGLAGFLNYGVDLSPVGGSSYTVSAYNGTSLVDQQTGHAGSPFATCNETINDIVCAVVYQSSATGNMPAAVVSFDAVHTVTIPGSSPVSADEIWVVAEGLASYDPVAWPTHTLEVTAANIDSFITSNASIGMFNGLAIEAEGDVILNGEQGSENDLVVSNIGSSGNDCIQVWLSGPGYPPTAKSYERGKDYYRAVWEELDPVSDLPADAGMVISTVAPDDATVSSTVTKTPSGWDITTDIAATGATTFTANLYEGAALVGTSSGLDGSAAITLWAPRIFLSAYEPVDSKGGGRANAWIQRFRWDTPVMVLLTGSGMPVNGDLLELIPEGGAQTYDTAAYARFCMTDIPTVTFIDMRVHAGCCEHRGDINHDGAMNGVPLIDDLVMLATFMFQDGPCEAMCDDNSSPGCNNGDVGTLSEADINGDGSPMPLIDDLVYLAAYMFQDGPAPIPCQ